MTQKWSIIVCQDVTGGERVECCTRDSIILPLRELESMSMYKHDSCQDEYQVSLMYQKERRYRKKYSMDTYRLYADEKIFHHSVRVKVLIDVLQHAVNVAICRYPYFAVEVTTSGTKRWSAGTKKPSAGVMSWRTRSTRS